MLKEAQKKTDDPSVRNMANALRAFFRYAGQHGWCQAAFADAIQGPRVFAQESLPSGPTWPQVQSLLACLDTGGPLAAGNQASLWATLLPAVWSYMLAARRRVEEPLDQAGDGEIPWRVPELPVLEAGADEALLLPVAQHPWGCTHLLGELRDGHRFIRI